jgi:hypothetical protein
MAEESWQRIEQPAFFFEIPAAASVSVFVGFPSLGCRPHFACSDFSSSRREFSDLDRSATLADRYYFCHGQGRWHLASQTCAFIERLEKRLSRFNRILESLFKETERGCALVAAGSSRPVSPVPVQNYSLEAGRKRPRRIPFGHANKSEQLADYYYCL